MDSVFVESVAAFDTTAVVQAVKSVTGLGPEAAYMIALLLMAFLARSSRLWKRFASKRTGKFPQWGPRIAGFVLAGVFSRFVLGISDVEKLIETTLLSGAAVIGAWEAGLQPIRGIWKGWIVPIIRLIKGGLAKPPTSPPAVTVILILCASALAMGAGLPSAALAQPADTTIADPAPTPTPTPAPVPPKRWDLKSRLSGGLGVGWTVYDDGLEGVEEFTGPLLKVPLLYNLSKYLSAAAIGYADPNSDRYSADLAVVVGLLGYKRGSDYHVALSAAYSWLFGGGYEALGEAKLAAGQDWKESRLKLSANLSWLILKDKLGRGAVGAQLVPMWIPDNNMKQFYGMLFWRGF